MRFLSPTPLVIHFARTEDLRLLHTHFLTFKSVISEKVLEKDLEEEDDLEEESESEPELELDLRDRFDLRCLAMLAMREQKKI